MGAPPLEETREEDWGDLVDLDAGDETEEVCESLELYEKGTFYPVKIGEVLHDRYQIQHKLGHGGFATIWLARDLACKKNIALKVVQHGRVGEKEHAMLNAIAKSVKDTAHLIVYEDTFLLDSPHGEHTVFVFPLHGPNLGSFSYREKLSIASRMSAAKQLLQALKSLHSAGIVHRGESTTCLRPFFWLYFGYVSKADFKTSLSPFYRRYAI